MKPIASRWSLAKPIWLAWVGMAFGAVHVSPSPSMRNVLLDTHKFDVQGRRHSPTPPLEGWRASTDKCPGLIGTGFGIEAATDRRCFLYLEAVVVSASEGRSSQRDA